MIDVGAYRVLVVDEEPEVCAEAQKQISEIAGPTAIYVDKAYTARVAINKVKASFYDLIVLDLYQDNAPVGYDVYGKLNALNCSAEVIFMTRFDLDSSINALLKDVASENSSRMVGFLDKREPRFGTIRTEVEKRYRMFTKAELTIANIELASKFISERRSRYQELQLFPLREDASEIEAEIERLLRELYVEVPAGSRRSTDVSLSFEPIELRGRGLSVVVNCIVRIGLPGVKGMHEGHKTVLKIGPKPDIREETSRYREFVRYGVDLDQRVELLGVAERDTLGGLVYSFAGDRNHKDPVALDDILTIDMKNKNESLSRKALQSLFKSRAWYSISTGDIDISQYFDVNYKNSLMKCFARSEEALFGLAQALDGDIRVERISDKNGRDSYFSIRVGDAKPLVVPNSSVLGLGAMYGSVPGCLVHGDMHGGNVMLEISEDDNVTADKRVQLNRACLIDFRNAGPGPRTIDAVALEGSVRLADSVAVCRRSNPSGEASLSTRERFTAAEESAKRYVDEVKLYRAVFYGEGEIASHGWQVQAAEILVGLKGCFDDLTLAEYLRTSIRYTLRKLGFPMSPVARIRLLAWLAAQYQLLQKIRDN